MAITCSHLCCITGHILNSSQSQFCISWVINKLKWHPIGHSSPIDPAIKVIGQGELAGLLSQLSCSHLPTSILQFFCCGKYIWHSYKGPVKQTIRYTNNQIVNVSQNKCKPFPQRFACNPYTNPFYNGLCAALIQVLLHWRMHDTLVQVSFYRGLHTTPMYTTPFYCRSHTAAMQAPFHRRMHTTLMQSIFLRGGSTTTFSL